MSNKHFYKVSNQAYGFSQALVGVQSAPIVQTRNPATTDMAEIGQSWINKSTGGYWVCAKIAANSATWATGATSAANFTTTGNITAGTTLIATTTATIGTGLTVSAGGITSTGVLANTGAVNVTGAIGATTTVTGGTGLVATTGGVTATAGNIVATAGNISTTAGSITSATTLTATLGNITATNGNLILTAAASYVSLPGLVFIRSGAGAPANGLALHIGDMYIRTDAGGATERIYVATGVGAWTNVTCAA